MEPRESPELIALFRQELEERSAALVEAARLFLVGALDPAGVEAAIRDAHTIKGSARLMGEDIVGNAAAVLERAWKEVAEGALEPTPALGAALVDLGERLGETATAGSPTRLAQARSRVERLLPSPQAGPAEQGALGGLLSSVTTSLFDGISRVDTAQLYRLINRLVEVTLDASTVADLSLVTLQGGDPARVLAAFRPQLERIASSLSEIQAEAVALTDVSFREAADTFPQFIRYLGRRLGKDVRLELGGEDVEMDRQIVEQLREPLRHLLVNAVDHGLETPEVRTAKGKQATGSVAIHAKRRDDRVQISVSDDGAGIDWKAVAARADELGLTVIGDLTPLLFRPDFSTRGQPDEFSGSGEGLSVVADLVERLHGGIQITSAPDEGTTVVLTLPSSLVLQNTLVVAVGDQFWGIPETAVLGTMALGDPRLELAESGRAMRFEGSRIPLISMARAVGATVAEPDQEVVVVAGRAGLVAVTVTEVIDRRKVAVKDLGPILEGTAHISAAAFLGGGEIVVVVDPHYLSELARTGLPEETERPRVLVVDDSAGVRQLISATLSGAGFEVSVASGARDAAQQLADAAFDALVVDYSMPRSSGVDLVRALRAADVTIPIVMVSGVATAAEQKAAWEAGVDAYMDKFDLRKGVLTLTLRRLLAGGSPDVGSGTVRSEDA